MPTMKQKAESAPSRSHWPISIFSILVATLSMLVPLILVRVLTPEEVGRFKIFFLYLFLSPVLTPTVGLQSGLSFWGGREEEWQKAFHATFLFMLISAVVAPLIVLGGHSWIEEWTGLHSLEVSLFALALFGTLASVFFEDAAIARGRIWSAVIYHTVVELIRVLGMIAAALFIQKLSAVLMVHAVMVCVRAVCGYFLGLQFKYAGFKVDREIAVKVLRYAFLISLAWAFGVLVTHVDQLLLSSYITPAEFAIYTLGCLAIPPLLILERSVTRVLIPEMAEAFSKNNNERAAELYSDAVRSLSFFMIPAAAGLAIFAKPIIELLFTPQYAEAASFLQIYSLYYILLLLPYDSVARARGDANWILRNLVFCSVCSLLLALTLVMNYGAIGALWSLILSSTLLRVTGAWYMVKRTGQSLTAFMPLRSLNSITAISLFCSAVSVTCRDLFVSERMWFLIMGVIFLVLYFFLSGVIGLFRKRLPSRATTEKPVVLTILQSINTGGLERMVLSLSQELKRNGKLLPVVATYDQDEADLPNSLYSEFQAAEIPVSVFKKSSGFSFRFLFDICSRIRRENITILHCHDLGGLIYGALASLFSQKQVYLYMTQHSFIHLKRHRRYALYEKLFSRAIDQLIVVSGATRDQYLEWGFAEDRISLIPNGVPFPAAKSNVSKARDNLLHRIPGEKWLQLYPHVEKNWILYLGRIFPGKGQLEAVMAWNELSEQYRQKSLLIIVGPDCDEQYSAELRGLIEKSPARESIFLAGGTNFPMEWITAADVFLSCSEFEGMPLAPLEALGSGVSSLLSDIPGHSMFEDVAVTYPCGKPAEAAKQLESIVEKLEAGRDEYRGSIWDQTARLRTDYSLETMVKRYSYLYSRGVMSGEVTEAAAQPNPVSSI